MEPLFAGVVFVLCVLGLVRLLLGPSRQQRVDASLRRSWFGLRVKALTLWRWRRNRRAADQAAREAIARASGRPTRRDTADDGEWTGNVYAPKTFKKPRKPH